MPILPIGGEDDGFKSSQISDGGMEGEYTVNLNFTVEQEILGKNYRFEVKNSLGTTIYQFYLEIPTDSPTVPSTDTSSTTISTTSSTTSSTTYSTTIIAPKCHGTTFKGMQVNQFSTVKIMLVANPEPTVIWHIDFGDNFDNSQIGSSQIKNGADENSYFVESSFIMTEDLNRKKGSLEIFNSNGNVFCNFTLALQYPPKDDPKIIIDLDSGFVEITFFANPEPTNGFWTIGNEKVPIGQKENPDTIFMSESLISSNISEGSLRDEYIGRLQFTNKPELAKQKCTFEVTNSIGENSYPFSLKPRFKPVKKSVEVVPVGKENFAKITFEAYPKVTSGNWSFDNVKVPVGETSIENKLIAYEISDGYIEDEYVASLNYIESAFVTNKMLTLELVNEIGYTNFEIDIKPQFKPEINHNWTLTGMQEGNASTIEIPIRANPKPTFAEWIVDNDIVVPMGESSTNATFRSSPIIDRYQENEYVMILYFTYHENMTRSLFRLEVQNLIGKVETNFNLPSDSNDTILITPTTIVKSGVTQIVIISILVFIICLMVIFIVGMLLRRPKR